MAKLLGLTPNQRRAWLSAIKDDFRFSTWLYLGALVQSLLFLLYPRRIVALPAILAILFRVFRTLAIEAGLLKDPLQEKALVGRSTAQVVNRDGSMPAKGAQNQVVVFVLGSHPNRAGQGRMRLDGSFELTALFNDMWKELAQDRDKWGFLGRTSTLFSSDEDHTNITAWISYWRSLEDLHRFARGPSHTKGLRWWTKKNPTHIGLMHETYVVPANHYENIYHNFRPFGLGQTKQPYEREDEKGQVIRGTTNGMFPIKGPVWSSMRNRMGIASEGPFTYP